MIIAYIYIYYIIYKNVHRKKKFVSTKQSKRRRQQTPTYNECSGITKFKILVDAGGRARNTGTRL